MRNDEVFTAEWFEPTATKVRDITDPDGNRVCTSCGYTGKGGNTGAMGGGPYCPKCGFNLKMWPWQCEGCGEVMKSDRNCFKFGGKRYCSKDCAEEHAG